MAIKSVSLTSKIERIEKNHVTFFHSVKQIIVSQYYIRNIMQLTNHLHITFSFYRSLIMLAYVNSAQILISSSSFRSGAWHKPSFACNLTCGSGYGFCAPHPPYSHNGFLLHTIYSFLNFIINTNIIM